MNYVANQFVNYLIINQLISEDREEIYVYQLEIILGKLLNYGTLLILALISHNILQTIVFMLPFFSLRTRTGGYHAPRELFCYLGSIVIYFGVSIIIAPLLMYNDWCMLIVIVISMVTVYLFAPINHPNLNLDENEIRVGKSTSRWLITLWSAIVVVLLGLAIIPEFIPYITAGIGMDAGLLIVAKIIKQEVPNC